MIAAFSVTPLGAGASVGELVADAVEVVRQSGLPCETNAMFTNIEGEWDEVMAVIKASVLRVAERAPRVSVVVKIDYRPGAEGALSEKRTSVERHLAQRPQGEGAESYQSASVTPVATGVAFPPSRR